MGPRYVLTLQFSEKISRIANNSTTTDAREKTRTDCKSSIYRFFDVSFANYKTTTKFYLIKLATDF